MAKPGPGEPRRIELGAGAWRADFPAFCPIPRPRRETRLAPKAAALKHRDEPEHEARKRAVAGSNKTQAAEPTMRRGPPGPGFADAWLVIPGLTRDPVQRAPRLRIKSAMTIGGAQAASLWRGRRCPAGPISVLAAMVGLETGRALARFVNWLAEAV